MPLVLPESTLVVLQGAADEAVREFYTFHFNAVGRCCWAHRTIWCYFEIFGRGNQLTFLLAGDEKNES